jgi:hypothetical protein
MQRGRVDGVVRHLPALATPVGHSAGGELRLHRRGVTPHQLGAGGDRALGERGIPDRVQVQPRVVERTIAGVHVVAALVGLLAGVERLVKVADEVDQEDERLDPVVLGGLGIAQQRHVAGDLRRDAIAVLARRGQVERLADLDVLIVPRAGRLVALDLAAHAIGPARHRADRVGLALGRVEHRGLAKQRVDTAQRRRPHVLQRDLGDRLVAEKAVSLCRGGKQRGGCSERDETTNHGLALSLSSNRVQPDRPGTRHSADS